MLHERLLCTSLIYAINKLRHEMLPRELDADSLIPGYRPAL